MSTSAAVFVKNKNDETFTGVRVHWDGYIDGGVGQTLAEHYNTYELANNLVHNKKDISSLNDTIEENDYFNDQCKLDIDNIDYYDMVNFGGNYDFLYLFEDNIWKVYRNGKFVNINRFLYYK